MGKLQLVTATTPCDTPIPHAFDQVSREARADPRVTDRGFRVLAAIEGYCWGDSRECWASNTTLGKQSGGVSAETVRRALRNLERAGYLRIEPDTSRKRGQRLVLLYELKRPNPLD